VITAAVEIRRHAWLPRATAVGRTVCSRRCCTTPPGAPTAPP